MGSRMLRNVYWSRTALFISKAANHPNPSNTTSISSPGWSRFNAISSKSRSSFRRHENIQRVQVVCEIEISILWGLIFPMPDQVDTSFQSLLHELRVISPPEQFAAKAHIRTPEDYDALYKRSIEDPEEFWAAAAGELHWFEPWQKVLEWNPPWAKWFVGGKMNLSYN